VIETIAATVGVKEGSDQLLLTLLKRHVRDKQLLLVLDNFEQVSDAAPLVAELLETAPRLKALVTSRACLQIYGESEFPIPPLALPDPQGYVKVHRSILSRPPGRIEGCGTNPFEPFDTRFALLRTLARRL
jgi:predicted ATPase